MIINGTAVPKTCIIVPILGTAVPTIGSTKRRSASWFCDILSLLTATVVMVQAAELDRLERKKDRLRDTAEPFSVQVHGGWPGRLLKNSEDRPRKKRCLHIAKVRAEIFA